VVVYLSKLLENKRIFFYDFEVLSKLKYSKTGQSWWCVVFIDFDTRKGKLIKNNVNELIQFYNQFKDSIFVGYNSRQYDQYIFKGLMLGMDAGYISEQLIEHKLKGHNVVRNAFRLPLNNFDIMPNPPIPLKTLEGFMGSDIQESSVPFTIDRELTDEEENNLIKYCIHDVKETIKVFERLRHEFDSQLQLIEAFDLDMTLFNKTKAQLSAYILDAKKHDDRGDAFDHLIPETLVLNKYNYVKEWYEKEFTSYIDPITNKGRKLETVVAGVPTDYGIGGIHSALKNIDESGIILACDISSMYPALIIEYNYMSRNVPSIEKYINIRDERLKLKAEKNPKQQPLKIVLNATFGTFKDKYNAMYDERMSNAICIAGQLLITDLAEKLEPHCKILQKNTDGIFMKVEKEEDIELVQSIAKEWEVRTRLDLEWDRFTRIIQKDVNNYILVPEGDLYYPNGKERWKAKGAFVKSLSDIDYDLPIVNKAVIAYFLENKPVEETINECNKLREFQKIVKVTSAYDEGAWKDCTFSKQKVLNKTTGKYSTKMMWDEGSGYTLKDKTFRVFASTRDEDGGLFKKKSGANPAKFQNTSEKVFIDNEDVTEKAVPDYLDKQFYIDLSNDRINQFMGIKKKLIKKKINN